MGRTDIRCSQQFGFVHVEADASTFLGRPQEGGMVFDPEIPFEPYQGGGPSVPIRKR
jgi:hypothetical protein